MSETPARYSAATEVLPIDPVQPDPDTIAQAAAVIQRGGLVAFPTETVYGLGANALDSAAVGKIFSAKMRPANDPLIVHLASADELHTVARDIPPLAYTLANTFWPGALTLVLPKQAVVPPAVTAGTDTVAVRVPGGRVAHALISAAGVPIAAPSANRFSRPSATHAAHVLADLGGHVDLVLDSGATPIGVESTIVDLTGEPVILRPGGVSLEQLRAVLPRISIRQRLTDVEANAGESAPGQLLKHYSPRTPLRLYTGDDTTTILARMIADATMSVAAGQQVGVLALPEEAEAFRRIEAFVHPFASSPDHAQLAHDLFAGLRSLDEQGFDVLLVRDYGRAGLGAAVWDRLLRAAEGKTIVV